MKKDYTEVDVYEAIKSGFKSLQILVREDLKKHWASMGRTEKYAAGRGLVTMRDVSNRPEHYFSRATTQQDWINRAEAYANEKDLDFILEAYYIVPNPQMMVISAVEKAMQAKMYKEYSGFCDDVQQWEYDRTSPKSTYRSVAYISAEKIIGKAAKYKKMADAELQHPIKKHVKKLIRKYVVAKNNRNR